MQDDILTRYENAQTISQGGLTDKLVLNDIVFPHWIENSRCFWYKRTIKDGKEFRWVDAEAAINVSAFDHEALANALTEISGETVDHQQLPFHYIAISLAPLTIHFQVFDKHWAFDSDNNHLKEVVKDHHKNLSLGVEKTGIFFLPFESKQPTLPSPDGKKEVFIRDYNVWLHDLLSGDIHPLTQDGTEDFCYSGALAGADPAVQACWSPDSNTLFTVRLDTRQVASRPFISYAPQQDDVLPQVVPTKMAYPGDDHVETYHLAIIHMATGQVQAVDYPPLPLMLNGSGLFGFFNGKPLGWWSPDSQRAFFVAVTRASKAVRVVELNPHTGATRVLFEETSDTFINLCPSPAMEVPQFLPLPDSNELIWFSELSGWAHLYLYDLNTGALKHPITQGAWLARRILHYDAKKREILLQTAGRDETVSPYYQDICVVNIDSGELMPLVPSGFEHIVTDRFNSFAAGEFILRGLESDDINGVSPCGGYIVTTRSRVDTVPISVLIDRQGRELLAIETADVSGLPSGWQWPEPVKLTGADGETDIYGVIYRPVGFSPDQSYPVIEHSCSPRNISSLPQGSFINSVFLNDSLQAISYAALGFIVVAIEGRGTPLRHKSFQDHHYGDLAYVNDFDDRIAGMRQLAKRYPYMDLERVGIVGHENQTNNIYSLLKHSDFYKVAITNCLYDPRFNVAAIGEAYDNTRDKAVVPKTGYPEDCVESFKGKLLLIQGMLSHLTPCPTYRLVEALQKANKDFDMLCLPNLNNAMTSYTIRREWDYLVTHLQGIEPPHEFQLKTGVDFLNEITL